MLHPAAVSVANYCWGHQLRLRRQLPPRPDVLWQAPLPACHDGGELISSSSSSSSHPCPPAGSRGLLCGDGDGGENRGWMRSVYGCQRRCTSTGKGGGGAASQMVVSFFFSKSTIISTGAKRSPLPMNRQRLEDFLKIYSEYSGERNNN